MCKSYIIIVRISWCILMYFVKRSRWPIKKMIHSQKGTSTWWLILIGCIRDTLKYHHKTISVNSFIGLVSHLRKQPFVWISMFKIMFGTASVSSNSCVTAHYEGRWQTVFELLIKNVYDLLFIYCFIYFYLSIYFLFCWERNILHFHKNAAFLVHEHF